MGYVKRNAIAGHASEHLEALHAHLARWMREIADARVHGTTGEPPGVRFEREAPALRALPGKAPFLQVRELSRRVHTDACIELNKNRYSVPWRLIGQSVTVLVAEQQLRVLHSSQEVACHAQSPLRRATVIERSHRQGIVGANTVGVLAAPRAGVSARADSRAGRTAASEVIGGAW